MRTIMLLALLVASCHSECRYAKEKQYADYARSVAEQDSLVVIAQQDSVRYAMFLECSKDQGDAGCDSCWIVVYGYSLEFK